MAQAIQDLNDEEMIDNCDEQKDDVRVELYMLLDELKRIGFSIFREVEKFLVATFAQPAQEQCLRAPSDIDSFENLSEQIAAPELQYPCFISPARPLRTWASPGCICWSSADPNDGPNCWAIASKDHSMYWSIGERPLSYFPTSRTSIVGIS